MALTTALHRCPAEQAKLNLAVLYLAVLGKAGIARLCIQCKTKRRLSSRRNAGIVKLQANQIKVGNMKDNRLFIVLAVFSAICLIIGYMLSRDHMSAWALLAFILSSWLALTFGFAVGLFAVR
jgi:hypothetical protein